MGGEYGTHELLFNWVFRAKARTHMPALAPWMNESLLLQFYLIKANFLFVVLFFTLSLLFFSFFFFWSRGWGVGGGGGGRAVWWGFLLSCLVFFCFCLSVSFFICFVLFCQTVSLLP